MELKVAMGLLRDQGAEADLKILLSKPENQNNGHLQYLMGRCCEDGKNDLEAKKCYEAAIKNNAPEKIEAYQRIATLLRRPDRLNEPDAADQVIEDMVLSSPEDYRVYLAAAVTVDSLACRDKGRADFEKALKLADDQPETFLEMAKTAAATESGSPTRRDESLTPA